jgi:chloramphenicol-sensitive protein RarD
MQLLCGVIVFNEAMPPERVGGFALVWVALVLLAADALRSARQAAPDLPVVEPA